MAPRKLDDKSTPIEKKKVGRKRVVKEKVEKPKLKTPTMIKVKIPLLTNCGTNNLPKLTKKQLFVQRKIELANEVARAQLSKDHPVPCCPLVDKPVNRNKGRQKKIQEFFSDTNNDNAEKSKGKSKLPNKKLISSPNQIDTGKRRVYRKRVADPSIQTTRSKTPKKSVQVTEAETHVKKEHDAEHNKDNNTSAGDKIAGNKKTVKHRANVVRGLRRNRSAGNVDNCLISDTKKLHIDDKHKESQKCAMVIASRKASLNSNSSVLSWTKDVSASSTTTCITVSSNDFVRFDKKLPIVRLLGINSTADRASVVDSSSESDNSESSDKSLKSLTDFESRSLNLSTSSITSPDKFPSVLHDVQDNLSKIGRTLDKLTSKLKDFDLEIVNWIGYQDEEPPVDVNIYQDKVFNVLKSEHEVLFHCQQMKRVLSDGNIDRNVCDPGPPENIDFVKPTATESFREHSVDADEYKAGSIIDRTSNVLNSYLDSEYFKNNADNQNRDEDTISLFAESITGLESSRRNSSTASMSVLNDQEEYIPEPVINNSSPPSYSYCPTKIDNTQISKTPCEKQKADSTSIYKASEIDLNIIRNNDKSHSQNNEAAILAKILNNETINSDKTISLASVLQTQSQVKKSTLLRNVCFFNLVSTCNKERCRFPHIKPTCAELRNALADLSGAVFLQEYISLRHWPDIRRKYGVLFVEEAVARQLTRVIIEMIIDFISITNKNRREDVAVTTEVTEIALMYLNDCDIELCADLLKININNTILCAELLRVIADTQNFSRFKPVFNKLTRFLIDCGMQFDSVVAEHILERVCILPCEKLLTRSVLDILKNTDSRIFQNSMMGQFEAKVKALDGDMYEEFVEVRERSQRATLTQPVLRSPYAMQTSSSQVTDNIADEKRYTSPDTTDLDNVNKPAVEPTFLRTINFGQTAFSVPLNSPNLRTNQAQDHFKMKPHQKWRHRSVLDNIRKNFTLNPTPIARSMNLPKPLRRQVDYGDGPTVCT